MSDLYIVSGMPHSATRLVFDLLNSTEVFSTPPAGVLNSVREFPVLHAYLTSVTKRSCLSESMDVSVSDIQFILDTYIELCDSTKPILIKMPYYPIVYRNSFDEAAKKLGFETKYIVVTRPLKNIKLSYINRNEDLKYSKPETLLSQVNRLPKMFKKQALLSKGYLDVLDLQYQAFSNELDSENDFEVNVNNLTALNNLTSALSQSAVIDKNLIDETRLNKNRMDWFKSNFRKLERVYLKYIINNY